MLRYFQSIAQGQRIYALGFCDRAGKLAYATPAYPEAVRCVPGERREARNTVLELADGPLHVSAQPDQRG